jgi:hypothetical protein
MKQSGGPDGLAERSEEGSGDDGNLVAAEGAEVETGLERAGQLFFGDAGLTEYLVERPFGENALVERNDRASLRFRVQVDSVATLGPIEHETLAEQNANELLGR